MIATEKQCCGHELVDVLNNKVVLVFRVFKNFYVPWLKQVYTQYSCALAYITVNLVKSTAICQSGCLHGNCISPEICTCDAGWTGDACNTGKAYTENMLITICQCARHANVVVNCSHAAICENGCVYGACIGPENCNCQTGWTGVTCNTGNVMMQICSILCIIVHVNGSVTDIQKPCMSICGCVCVFLYPMFLSVILNVPQCNTKCSL